MKKHIHETCRQKFVLGAACGTTGTGLTGKVIDRKGFNGVEFVIGYGAVTATDATIAITVLEGDVTGTMTSVADADLLGTEALAGLGAAVRTDFTGDKIATRIGYVGRKRYVTIKEVPLVTAAVQVSVIALLHSPELSPTANP